MPTQITNQATLTYQYGQLTGTAASNIATAVLNDPLTLQKRSLFSYYEPDEEITYTLSVTNNGANSVSDITVTDNLGTYSFGQSDNVVPLAYTGPAYLYINGVYNTTLSPTVQSGSVTFTIPQIAAGSTAMILYKARVNNFAQIAAGSVLVNSVTATIPGSGETVRDAYLITVAGYADVRIVKSMSPNPIAEGDTITYTFTIYNFGNTAATNVVLTDDFDPEPQNITVTVGTETIPDTDYTYSNGTLTLPTGGTRTLTVPAATFTQSTTTGAVTTSPGMLTITVTGTIA
ncbi:MAG: hypothetical protein Q4C04_05375 [Clostridia bacterium]|nr:hypothetical protein [Clostridia bacterium]